MSILDDLISGLKSWVRNVVDSAISGLKAWTRNLVKAAIDAVDWTLSYISEYITNVYKTFNEYITNVSNTFNEYISNVVNNFTTYVTNVYNTTQKYITNVTKYFNTYVTNVYGINEAWVRNFFKLMDPTGFLKDPLGYIQGAFNNFIDFWIHGTIRSLAEGLQIGLAGNPPEPEGPGASFKAGFNSVVNEEERHMGHG